jgi:hypothetical protein
MADLTAVVKLALVAATKAPVVAQPISVQALHWRIELLLPAVAVELAVSQEDLVEQPED